MKAPSVPVLELRDIHAPALPDLWPPAPGWWVLAGLLLSLAFFAGRRLWGRRRLRQRRRQVLEALARTGDKLAEGQDATLFLAEVSMLLRRVALARYPRRRVASLVGSEWLRFLDETGGEGQFSHGPARILGLGPYLPRVEVEAQGLLDLARDWVCKNIGDRYER
jgi:hypothetical protein